MDSWLNESRGPEALIRWIALLPMLAALVHGVLIGFARARMSPRSISTISMSALLASFSFSALLLYDFVRSEARRPMLDPMGPWIGGGVGHRSFSAELTFQFDPLSAVFCLALTTIALAVYLFAMGAPRSADFSAERSHRTFATLDLLVGSALLLFLADNFLLFFLGWVGIGISSHQFSSFALDSKQAGRAGATTFVIGRIGDLGLLGAMLLLFDGLSRSGAPSITFRGIEGAYRLLEGQEILLIQQTGIDAPLLLELVGVGLVIAAMTKCAQLPVQIWLSGAGASPIPASALIQSLTTVGAGVYVLLRFSFLLESAPMAMTWLVAAGAVTMLLASLAAANQRDLTRFLAYTTSSHLGLILVGVGLGAPSVATFHLLTHGFMKAHAILALAAVLVVFRDPRTGEADLRKMGGLGARMRWTMAFAALAFLGLAGFPPLAGFFSIEESLAFIQASESPASPVLLGLSFFSLAVLAFACARVFCLIFLGNVRPGGRDDRPLHDPVGWPQRSLVALSVLTFSAGLLTPSDFWGEVWGVGVSETDSIGFFLADSIAGAPDPDLPPGDRWPLIGGLLLSVGIGLLAGLLRYAKRGYPGEPKRPASRWVLDALREMLFIEALYARVLVRPVRMLSRWGLEVAIEQRLLDRVVVSGGSSLVRRSVWSVLRRIQNGRMQSYALLALLGMLAVLSFMLAGSGPA